MMQSIPVPVLPWPNASGDGALVLLVLPSLVLLVRPSLALLLHPHRGRYPRCRRGAAGAGAGPRSLPLPPSLVVRLAVDVRPEVVLAALLARTAKRDDVFVEWEMKFNLYTSRHNIYLT